MKFYIIATLAFFLCCSQKDDVPASKVVASPASSKDSRKQSGHKAQKKKCYG